MRVLLRQQEGHTGGQKRTKPVTEDLCHVHAYVNSPLLYILDLHRSITNSRFFKGSNDALEYKQWCSRIVKEFFHMSSCLGPVRVNLCHQHRFTHVNVIRWQFHWFTGDERKITRGLLDAAGDGSSHTSNTLSPRMVWSGEYIGRYGVLWGEIWALFTFVIPSSGLCNPGACWDTFRFALASSRFKNPGGTQISSHRAPPFSPVITPLWILGRKWTNFGIKLEMNFAQLIIHSPEHLW